MAKSTGQWAIPMGKQEFGETPVQCEMTGLLGIFSDPGHIVYYDSDGETRHEYEIIFTGRPASGTPMANDEASDAGWFAPGELDALDIHPTQWRQLRHWLDGTYPHFD
jgi:8-oxo-dGTP pyrophosphatase MutT (NUDIX family)